MSSGLKRTNRLPRRRCELIEQHDRRIDLVTGQSATLALHEPGDAWIVDSKHCAVRQRVGERKTTADMPKSNPAPAIGSDLQERVGWHRSFAACGVSSVLNMGTVAFVQARMGSTRFPGKVLELVEGRPILLWITDRLTLAPGLDRVLVLTSDLAGDDAIASLCRAEGVECVRGAEMDVLDRFHVALGQVDAERVVRITADCPLIDPDVIGDLLALHDRSPGLAYASVATGALPGGSGYRRFPDGLDAEVVTATALTEAWSESRDVFEREHVTPFIWRRPERFPAAALECAADHGDERWTVDFPEDLEFVRAVYARLSGEQFGWTDVLGLLEREPGLRQLNVLHRAGID